MTMDEARTARNKRRQEAQAKAWAMLNECMEMMELLDEQELEEFYRRVRS